MPAFEAPGNEPDNFAMTSYFYAIVTKKLIVLAHKGHFAYLVFYDCLIIENRMALSNRI